MRKNLILAGAGVVLLACASTAAVAYVLGDGSDSPRAQTSNQTQPLPAFTLLYTTEWSDDETGEPRSSTRELDYDSPTIWTVTTVESTDPQSVGETLTYSSGKLTRHHPLLEPDMVTDVPGDGTAVPEWWFVPRTSDPEWSRVDSEAGTIALQRTDTYPCDPAVSKFCGAEGQVESTRTIVVDELTGIPREVTETANGTLTFHVTVLEQTIH